MNQAKQLLLSGAEQMGIPLNDEQVSQLLNYLTLMLKWNKTYSLSAIKSIEDGVKKHLLDSLSIMPYIKAQPLLDVGSGAGLPGIVISIIKPELAVVVLDSGGKKCRFMQFAKTQLQLANLSVVNTRVEDYHPEFCFAQIVSRAFAEVDKTLKLSRHLLCDNGAYLLMKGANFQQECLPENTQVHQLSVPQVSDERFLLAIPSKK